MSVTIVTDSTADIPEEFTQAYPIHVVPNIIMIEGQSLVDGEGISRQEFYERLPEMKKLPTTATASIGTYQALYEQILQQRGGEIVSLHPPSSLSGILNAANAAAAEFGERVWVVDSGYISMGLGLQAIACAEAALKGASLPDIKNFFEKLRKRVRLVAMLDTLEYIRRSGRVSWARAQLGNILQIKPFIEVRDGEVLSRGNVRTRHKGIERLSEMLTALGALERLAILHTNAEAEARQFVANLRLGQAMEVLVVNVTTVIGTHVGPNGLGFAAVLQ